MKIESLETAVKIHKSGDFVKADNIYKKLLKINPLDDRVLHLSGLVDLQYSNFKQAKIKINKAISLNPNVEAYYSNLGTLLLVENEVEEAIKNFKKAIKLNPKFVDAYFNLGNACKRNLNYYDAKNYYKQAILINPQFIDSYINLGVLEEEFGNKREAKDAYNAGLKIQKNNHVLITNLGNLLYHERKYNEAIGRLNEALEISPLYDLAYSNKGNVFYALRQYENALECYKKAIDLKPNFAQYYMNMGNAYKKLVKYHEAISSYQKAVQINPNYANGYNNLGNLLNETKQYAASVDAFKEAIRIDPQLDYVYGALISSLLNICFWQGLDGILQKVKLLEAQDSKLKISPPFQCLTASENPLVQLRAANIWMKERFPPNAELGLLKARSGQQKIRVGYFSADFYLHAVSILSVGVFESHDRARFEVIGFSSGVPKADPMRERLQHAFDQLIDIHTMDDMAVAQLCRQMEIDIAVDMGGYTQDARPGVFSYRAAPVQVSFLGYPGTSGSEYMDYLIADEVVVPRQSQAYYSEKIVYMPDCYMPMDSKRVIGEHIFSRQELGLPPQGFVFCCFNNSYKINPTIFDVWVRILKAVPGSVLWLREIHVQAAENLRQNAIERGLDPSRLVFAPMIEMPQHLARHRAADLFLDTLPFNAHTTASDALWAGLPVLTCAGRGFASRVAASMLNTLGLKELVTESLENYEQKAIELAQQPHLLKALRDKLASAKHASALFDTASYTKHLEDAFCSLQKSSAKHH